MIPQQLTDDEYRVLAWFRALKDWQRKALIAASVLWMRGAITGIDCEALARAFESAYNADQKRKR